MEAIVIEVKNEADAKFWLGLAKKPGTKAKSLYRIFPKQNRFIWEFFQWCKKDTKELVEGNLHVALIIGLSL